MNPRVSLVAIMQDEMPYVERWYDALRGHCFDEVVVVDGGSQDETSDWLMSRGVRVVPRPFKGDFSAQRNAVEELARNDWVFHLDADEIFSPKLLTDVREVAAALDRRGRDCAGIPRLNFLDDHLQAGRGHQGLDFQYRLKKRALYWSGRVHESVAERQSVELDIAEGFYLLHMKSRVRHDARNAYYGTLELA